MRNERYQECALFAKELHGKQVDKGGNPYFYHLYEVATNIQNICQKLGISDSDFIHDCMEIALLHDSMEDCNLPFQVIYEKYGEEVAKGVLLMTKPKVNLPNKHSGLFSANYIQYLTHLYEQYTKQESSAFKAMIVKLSDLKSNLNYRRLGITHIDELNHKQLNNLLKYHTAYLLLQSILFNQDSFSVNDFRQYLTNAQPADKINTDDLQNSIDKILHG